MMRAGINTIRDHEERNAGSRVCIDFNSGTEQTEPGDSVSVLSRGLD